MRVSRRAKLEETRRNKHMAVSRQAGVPGARTQPTAEGQIRAIMGAPGEEPAELSASVPHQRHCQTLWETPGEKRAKVTHVQLVQEKNVLQESLFITFWR